MKKMVDDLVTEVRMEKNVKRFASAANSFTKTKGKSKSRKKSARSNTKKASTNSMQCPKCGNGKVLKGSTRYGCSAYKSGCDFAIPFEFKGKKISDNQIKRLVDKGSTVKLKGFTSEHGKVDGKIVIGDDKKIFFQRIGSNQGTSSKAKATTNEMPACPKCKEGKLIKGKTAYGCTRWKSGCDFRFNFADIKKKAAGKKLTKEVVLKIISS